MKHELKKFYGKDPLNSGDLSHIVNANHFCGLSNLLNDTKVIDKVVHGAQRDENNLKIAPTILLNVPHDSLIMKEEIFGPLLPIITGVVSHQHNVGTHLGKPTYWISPINNATDMDCLNWNNDQTQLCYFSDSCKGRLF